MIRLISTNHSNPFLSFLVMERLLAFCTLIVFPHFLIAQESHSRTYKVNYKVLYEQIRLDASAKLIKGKDSVYLQSSLGEIDSLIVKIASSKKGLLSNVSFGEKEESDKLFVNPFLIYDDSKGTYVDREQVYYYRLENRQSVKIRFNHFSVKAISVPLKVRIGKDDLEFSTEANLGAFGGYSWGKSKFTRREKIGNTEVEVKNTLGILLGTENLEFTFEDENQERFEEESALISTGIGFVHSYQNFTVGLTMGYDFALGENRTEWDYHARPWLGLAIGYSIFSF